MCLYNYGKSLSNIMNVYNLELVRKNEKEQGGTHKHDVISVYC